MEGEQYYLISQVVEQLRGEFPDISVSKVRYLDKEGLLGLQRSESGFRRFQQQDIDQLRWILTQQRDSFLPIREIRKMLESGEWAETQPKTKARTPKVELTKELFQEKTGLTDSQIREMKQNKLLSSGKGAKQTFNQFDLEVARLAKELEPLGLELRHLRAYALTAERHADIANQLTRTLSAKNSQQGAEDQQKIAALGSELQRVVLSRMLEES